MTSACIEKMFDEDYLVVMETGLRSCGWFPPKAFANGQFFDAPVTPTGATSLSSDTAELVKPT